MSDQPATKADIENVLTLIQQMSERVDQRFDAVERRFDAVDRHFQIVENRMDRIGDTLAGVQAQMAAATRWADGLDRDHNAVLATQVAQQRVIDDLAARVMRLEGRKQSN